MRGLVVWSLALSVILASGVTAQVTTPEVPNPEILEGYIGNLEIAWPRMRDLQGGGARAMGMGGAYVAISDDATAVSWNPAGLFQKDNPFEKPVMSLSWRSFGNKSEFRNTGFGSAQQFAMDDRFNDIDFASFLAPIRIKGHTFIFSGAYGRQGEEAYSNAVSILDSTFYWRPGEDRSGKKTDSLEGILNPWNYDWDNYYHSAINALNMGFGTRLYEDLTFGLAVNAYFGRAVMEGRQSILEQGLVIRADGLQRGTAEFVRYVIDSTSYSGVYFTVGFQYAIDKLRAGLVVKTPHTLKEDIDVTSENTIYENGISRSTVTIYSDNNVLEIDMPLVVQFGTAYSAMENLLLAADLEYRNSSGDKVNRRDSLRLVPGGKDTEYFTEIDPHWNNVFGVRLGAEYLLNTGSAAVPMVVFRGGFGWSQVPESNIDGATWLGGEDVEFQTSTASKSRLSLGAGARWSQIHLDFAFYHESLDLKNETFENLVPGLSASNETKVKNNTFAMTFTGFF